MAVQYFSPLFRGASGLLAGVLLLIDEVESHLHPKWQRLFLPALLRVIQRLTGEVQVYESPEKLNQKLQEALPGNDPFWPR